MKSGKLARRISLLLVALIGALAITHRYWPKQWTAYLQQDHDVINSVGNVSYTFNMLNHPTGLGIVNYGSVQYLYIADTGNHVIRVFTPLSGGALSTVAGIEDSPGYVNGNQSVAKFNYPTGMMVTGQLGQRFCQPRNMVFPIHSNTIYLNDAQNFITRKIVHFAGPYDLACGFIPHSDVTTEAGSGVQGWVDGPGASACFSGLGGITDAGGGICYMADAGNHCIRMWDGSNVSTFAGNGSAGFVDGFRTSAQFNVPGKVTKDAAGNLYVADIGNNAVRRIDTSGNVSTCAGGGPSQAELIDGPGASAKFYNPTSVVYNSADNMLYVADSHNNCIRRIDMAGNVTTYAGASDGTPGLVNGSLSAARFGNPTDLVIFGGVMYISDTNNNAIRRIDMASGTVLSYIN